MDEQGYDKVRKRIDESQPYFFDNIRLKDYWKAKFYPETNQQDQRVLLEA
jgi:hypothetical protein